MSHLCQIATFHLQSAFHPLARNCLRQGPFLGHRQSCLRPAFIGFCCGALYGKRAVDLSCRCLSSFSDCALENNTDLGLALNHCRLSLAPSLPIDSNDLIFPSHNSANNMGYPDLSSLFRIARGYICGFDLRWQERIRHSD